MRDDVHRSVRGNYLRLPYNMLLLFWLLLLMLCVCCSLTSQMGDQCDFTASGVSGTAGQERGVTPVYLRCSQGRVSWSFPRGALRVLLTLPAPHREFRACIRASKGFSGARVLVEGPRSLTPLYAGGDGGHELLPRCFLSSGGRAALYVEALQPAPLTPHRAQFSYDLEAIPSQGTLRDLVNRECRPCGDHELAHAYCTSDLVTRGTISSVDDLPELEQARIQVRVRRTLRHSTPAHAPPPAGHQVNYTLPRHCEPQTGPGEFVLMGRQRLGDLALTCAATLSQWALTAASMNADGSAHCVLTS